MNGIRRLPGGLIVEDDSVILFSQEAEEGVGWRSETHGAAGRVEAGVRAAPVSRQRSRWRSRCSHPAPDVEA